LFVSNANSENASFIGMIKIKNKNKIFKFN